jgi:hypothetical protein
MKFPLLLTRGAALSVSAALLTGCVSSRFQMAAPGVPPLLPLEIVGRLDRKAEVSLEGVVVYHGLGSWKRDAFWDEYQIAVENRSGRSLELSGAHLIGPDGAMIAPGQDWQKLEARSRAWWSARGLREGAQAGGSAIVGVVGGTALLLGMLGIAGTSGGVVAGGEFWGPVLGTVAGAGLLLGPNLVHAKAIDTEFGRRLIPLPKSLPPARLVRGSLFFPITPKAQALELTFSGAGGQQVLRIDLAAARDVHRPALP